MVRAHLVALLLDGSRPLPQRLTSLDDLNRHLADAPSLDACARIVEQELPEDVLKAALDLVAAGGRGFIHSSTSQLILSRVRHKNAP